MPNEERFPGHYNSDGRPLPGGTVMELPIQTRQAIFHAGRAAGIMAFMEQILHGSEEHRTWLRKAAESFVAGVPIMTEQEIKDNRCHECRWIYGEHSPDCRYYKPKDFSA